MSFKRFMLQIYKKNYTWQVFFTFFYDNLAMSEFVNNIPQATCN